ncbi:dihydroneopterin aldolase [Guyparkeria sp.]|uniref:dihydroneopterin aldolase n=1 Tax=Guyparkeria sp. TaxID=2035736 RepID=UPI0035648226
MTEFDHAPLSPVADRILVEGLTFDAVIGILPHEREAMQPLRVDLVLEVDSVSRAAEADHIDRTVDYAVVSRRVIEIAREGRFQLVETLAERVCADLLGTFPVRRVTFRVLKPNALAEAAGVGVQITREREAEVRS